MTDKPSFRIGCNRCGIVHEDWECIRSCFIKIHRLKSPNYKIDFAKPVTVAHKLKCNVCGSECFCGNGTIMLIRATKVNETSIAETYTNLRDSDPNSIGFTKDNRGDMKPTGWWRKAKGENKEIGEDKKENDEGDI